jgi:ferritin
MPEFKKSLRDRVNEQIKNELNSSHEYLAMSAWFEENDLPGMASWMRTQAEEERGHAMKFYQHLIDRNAKVELQSVDKPKSTYKKPLDVFKTALGHEQEVTRQIYELYEEAQKQKDHALKIFLDWFVTEQVEEENTFDHIVAQVKRVGDDPAGLMLLDRELGSDGSA